MTTNNVQFMIDEMKGSDFPLNVDDETYNYKKEKRCPYCGSFDVIHGFGGKYTVCIHCKKHRLFGHRCPIFEGKSATITKETLTTEVSKFALEDGSYNKYLSLLIEKSDIVTKEQEEAIAAAEVLEQAEK